MKLPDLPEQIDRDAWLSALESVGIPCRSGFRMTHLSSDVDMVKLTFLRDDGERPLVAGTSIATVQVVIGLTPRREWAGTLPDSDGDE